jgi:anti-anti-sigma factor
LGEGIAVSIKDSSRRPLASRARPHATNGGPPGEAVCLIDTDLKGTTGTVTIAGELDLFSKAKLDAAIAEAFGHAPERIVIDLSATTFIDSTGITALLRAHRRASARSVGMAIIPGGHAVRAALAMCGADTVLPLTAP